LYLATCPSYIFFLVNLLYGDKWRHSSAPALLAFFGVYLLLLGVNGLVESHRDAISPYDKIEKQSSFVILSVFMYFVIGAPAMYYFGAGGLIAASCVNTLIRCIYNINFFKDYMFPISQGIPTADFLIMCAIVLSTGTLSRYLLGDSWKHIGFGIFQGVVVGAWLVFFQRKKLQQTWQILKQKRN